MAFFSHPAWRLSFLAIYACGADAGDGSSRAAGAAPVARPEPDENGVRVRGAEPNTFNDDGIAECAEVRREVSIEEARDLGLPIDTHLAWFAQRHESSFHAPVSERQGQLAFAVSADIRNFEGTLELPVNLERMHYAELGIAANIGSEEMTGSLQPAVIYVDVEPWTAGEGEFLYFPARSGAADWDCWTNGAGEPVPEYEPFTLDTYPGSNPPVSSRAGDGRVSVVLVSNGCVVAAADCSGMGCSSNYAAPLAPPNCG